MNYYKAFCEASLSLMLLVIHVAIVSIICSIIETSFEAFLFILIVSIWITAFIHRIYRQINNLLRRGLNKDAKK